MAMKGHWTDKFSFVGGAIRAEDLGYLVLSDDHAAALGTRLSGFVQWEPKGWGDGGQEQWLTAGVSVALRPREQLIAIGEHGEVLLVGSGDRHTEQISVGNESPKSRGPLRGVRRVDGNIYVVGMDYQVYRRDDEGRWASLETGLREKRASDEVVGFEAVDGFSQDDMYAVGWDGVIGSFDGSRWTRRESPTELVLVDVCCAGDGKVYACGRRGMLVSGRDDTWEIVDTGVSEDLWNLAWFGGKLYAASTRELYVLDRGKLAPVKMGKDRPKTFGKLATGANRMWSIGEKDAMAFDGKKWTRID